MNQKLNEIVDRIDNLWFYNTDYSDEARLQFRESILLGLQLAIADIQQQRNEEIGALTEALLVQEKYWKQSLLKT